MIVMIASTQLIEPDQIVRYSKIYHNGDIYIGDFLNGKRHGLGKKIHQDSQGRGEWIYKDFPVFGPKALAGIGNLPDTVQDRGIPIEMRRKLKTEETEKFRRRKVVQDATTLAEALATWADEAVPILEVTEPGIPEKLNDRAADVWESRY